jgi:hypothetical protein
MAEPSIKPVGRIRRFGRNVSGMALLAGLVGAHYLAGKWYMRHRANRQRMLNSNRLVFSKLPHTKQRAILSYRKKQLGSMQSIYKSGQYQRGMGVTRRRKVF